MKFWFYVRRSITRVRSSRKSLDGRKMHLIKTKPEKRKSRNKCGFKKLLSFICRKVNQRLGLSHLNRDGITGTNDLIIRAYINKTGFEINQLGGGITGVGANNNTMPNTSLMSSGAVN